jgi:hypothetical protein
MPKRKHKNRWVWVTGLDGLTCPGLDGSSRIMGLNGSGSRWVSSGRQIFFFFFFLVKMKK